MKFEQQARRLANDFKLQLITTPHPFDALEVLGHSPDEALGGDSHITMDLVMFAAADAYRHFVGPNKPLERPISREEIEALVDTLEWEDRHMTWGYEGEVTEIAYRYLSGQGADYETFLKY